MANNHCLDYKAPALLDTIRRMKKLGVQVVGAGANAAAAYKFAYITRKGVTIAFMQWTDIMPPGYAATATGPGAAVGPRLGALRQHGQVQGRHPRRQEEGRLRGGRPCTGAWKVSTTPSPSRCRRATPPSTPAPTWSCRHHPHFLQGAEAYHGGLIMYSFGDLVFPPRSLPAAQTVLMTSTLTKSSIVASMVPVILDSQGVPRIAHGSMAKSILIADADLLEVSRDVREARPGARPRRHHRQASLAPEPPWSGCESGTLVTIDGP